MTTAKFTKKAVSIVRDYANDYFDKPELIPWFDVFIISVTALFGSMKALISTSLNDNRFYELTYNRQKDEIYMSVFEKVEGKIIPRK